MGSCASVHKGSPGSAVKLGVAFESKTDNLVIPESPIKDKQAADQPPIKTFGDFGSKDESFFDTQPWLDSDCEDDFYSVKGDFTPSRGSTPVHHSFSSLIPQVKKIPFEDRLPGSTTEPSPTGKKKRLSELFRESLGGDQDTGGLPPSSASQNTPIRKMDVKTIMLEPSPKSVNGTPFISGANSFCSSERTANGDALLEREKSIRSVQCCLPSLISCRSFTERKKKMSPAIAVDGK